MHAFPPSAFETGPSHAYSNHYQHYDQHPDPHHQSSYAPYPSGSSSYPSPPQQYQMSLPPQEQYHHLSNAVESSRWQASQSYSPPSTSAPLWIDTRGAPAANVTPISEVLNKAEGHSQLDEGWLRDGSKTVADALQTLNAGNSSLNSSAASPTWGSYSERVQAFDQQVAAASQVSKVKPFISKLAHLLSHPESYADCITWDDAGQSFIVSHGNPRLLQVVLPKMFQHSNIQSFTRQLNVYDFRRLPLPEVLSKLDLKSANSSPTTGDYSGWAHPEFTRDHMADLETFTPRPSKARLQKKMEKEERKRKELRAGAHR